MNPYDPTLKAMVETEPAAWLSLLNERHRPVKVIDADIATISGAADKVIRVGNKSPWLLHLEFHARKDATGQAELFHVRNSLLAKRHEMPVQTLVLILIPEADSPQLNGTFLRQVPNRPKSRTTFEYEVCHIWELDPETLLRGGAGLLPLVPLSNVTFEQITGIIPRMRQRMDELQVTREQAATLWAATNILLGVHFSPEMVEPLLHGVTNMEESSTYMAILHKGEARAFRAVVVDLATPACGEPDAESLAALEAITDATRLPELVRQAPTATSWQMLLGAKPAKQARKPRKV